MLFAFLCGILTLPGCPTPFSQGALSAGRGWSSEVAIKNGIIHVASINYDRMTVEYAHKTIGDQGWNVETVDNLLPPGVEAYKIGGVDFGGELRMAVSSSGTIYLLYAGLDKDWNDGALDGVGPRTLKLAAGHAGKWLVTEAREFGERERLELFDLKVEAERVYGLYTWAGITTFDGGGGILVSDGSRLETYPATGESLLALGNSVFVDSTTRDTDTGQQMAWILEIDLTTGSQKTVLLQPSARGASGFMVANSRGEVETLLDDSRSMSRRYLHAMGRNEWRVTEMAPLEVPADSSIGLVQGVYDGGMFALFERFDEADSAKVNFSKTRLGLARVDGQEFDVEWLEVPGMVDRARFDVEQPYKVISFLTTKTQSAKKNGPGGKRSYKVYTGQPHVLIWDGSAWNQENVE